MKARFDSDALYFLDMAVLILSVISFHMDAKTNSGLKHFCERNHPQLLAECNVLAVIYACVFTLSRTYRALGACSMRDAYSCGCVP